MVVKTLGTITSKHKDFKQVLIHFFQSSLDFGSKGPGGRDWEALDDALVKLWDLHRICVKVILYTSRRGGEYKKTKEEYRAPLKMLLPKATKNMEGEIQIELGSNERSELPPFPCRSERSNIYCPVPDAHSTTHPCRH